MLDSHDLVCLDVYASVPQNQYYLITEIPVDIDTKNNNSLTRSLLYKGLYETKFRTSTHK